ncbi:MAG: NmrA family transcriptional regulator [bacterium]
MTALYLVHPDLGSPQATQAIAALAHQAAAAGAQRAVLLSVPGGAGDLDQQHFLGAEDALGDAGLEWTVLRPRWFFQNFSEDFLRDAVMSGELRLPAGDSAEAFIDADDIAEVAVAALTENGHAGRHYELTGPRLMTFAHTAEEIARASGRDIRYVPLTPEAYLAEQREQGVPEEWVQLSADLYEPIRSGALASLTTDVRSVLGRPPRDFAEYAKQAATQGAWHT